MKRRSFCFILAFCLLAALIPGSVLADELTVWDGSTAEAFSGGSGTEEDPYRIADGAQLALLGKQADGGNTNEVYYILTEDIDLGNRPWTPIGSCRWAYCKFQGNFDGRGHSVTNLFVDAEVTYGDTGETYAGLFGYVDCGIIRNLAVSGTVQSTRSALASVGGVAGALEGNKITIWNDTFSKELGSLISDCSFSGSVTVRAESSGEKGKYATAYAGGIAGMIGTKSAVLNCRNSGTVSCFSSNQLYAGGIAGTNRLLIGGCSNMGDVTGESAAETVLSGGQGYYNRVGGIVGQNYGFYQSASVENCRNTGSVSAEGGYIQAGGIVGYNYLSSGYSHNATVKSCFNAGPVSGSSPLAANLGGIIGSLWCDTQLLNCYSTGAVTGGENAKVGGLIGLLDGFNSGFTINSCYSAGPLKGGDGAKVGGIIGEIKKDSSNKPKVTGCYFLQTEEADPDLKAIGSYYSWYKDYGNFAPLSAESLGDPAVFESWDDTVWKLGTDLDPDACPATSRPILIDPDETDTSIPAMAVSLDRETLTLSVGGTARLSATVLPADATDKTVQWGTSTPSVADVDENGVITAIAPGTARIAAASGSVGAVCEVTVTAVRVGEPVFTDGGVTVPVFSAADGSAFLAAYDGEGRFISGTVLPLNAGSEVSPAMELPTETVFLRLFVTDPELHPLTPPSDIPVKQ